MPPRYAYWTIIAGGLPTAFRAAERDELLPTFRRIKEKHPDAQMKYFARGKLWESQDEARGAQRRGGGRTRPDGGGRDRERGTGARPNEAGRDRERRDRDWRPGGDHRDPRQKFVDAKKARNAAMREDRWRRKNTEGVRGQVSGFTGGQGNRPPGNSPGNRPSGDRPQGAKPQGSRPPGTRPQGARPQGKRPFGDKRPWDRKPWVRGQGTEERPQPPRPRGPNREPRPSEEPKPTPPPRPTEPVEPPPGPAEQGREPSRRRFQPRPRFRKNS